jgi:hypothetical protein
VVVTYSSMLSPHKGRNVTLVLSTDQEMAPPRNATDAHAQYFMVIGVLLLPILKAFAHCTHSVHAIRNA